MSDLRSPKQTCNLETITIIYLSMLKDFLKLRWWIPKIPYKKNVNFLLVFLFSTLCVNFYLFAERVAIKSVN